MSNVSWSECQEFLANLRKKVRGRHFRLPSEAQWEYTCRAGSSTEYNFGDGQAQLARYALVCADNALRPRHRKDAAFNTTVGKKKPNAWRLHDMRGNVHELCADWYGKDYYIKSPLKDPRGPRAGYARVVRGGSFGRYGRFARSAYRFLPFPDEMAAPGAPDSGSC